MSLLERGSGILLHPTALPGPYGIGTFGAPCHDFLDFLQKAKQKYWQICPLGPTGYGDSPYQGFSAFAGNSNLIDLEILQKEGFLEASELALLGDLPDHQVDFGRLIPLKEAVLRKAWRRFNTPGKFPAEHGELALFQRESAFWLKDYCLFRVLKERAGGASWEAWEPAFRLRDPQALETIEREGADSMGFYAFLQFLFARQWEDLKKAAARRNIKIIGDLPIFVSYDSADCWSRPELFLLDDQGRPTEAAGVPPDYFSSTGQLWGNPLYNWDRMAENGYSWWIDILRHQLTRYDILRIDHFRGFSACWAVPAGEETAVKGRWLPSPGRALFAKVRETLGTLPIIAEDLGLITDDVRALMGECGFPGMKILQFAFDSAEENNYLPHTYPDNCVVYTGTHDNDTTLGWFQSAAQKDLDFLRHYLDYHEKDVPGALIHAALASAADLAVFPLQDIFRLGSQARFNTPGTQGGNWTWRVDGTLLTFEAAASLAALVREQHRD